VRSVAERSLALSDVTTARRLDVFALTETWHKTSDDLPLQRSAPPGYSVVAAEARPSKSTSRVAVIHSNRFTAKRITLDVKPTMFEVLCCSLRSASVSVVYVIIYRPDGEQVSEQFFEELTALLEIVATFRCQLIVTGDFNIRVNNSADRHAVRLAELPLSLDKLIYIRPLHSPPTKTATFWTSSHVQTVNHPAASSIHPTSSLTIPSSSVSSHPSRLPFDG